MPLKTIIADADTKSRKSLHDIIGANAMIAVESVCAGVSDASRAVSAALPDLVVANVDGQKDDMFGFLSSLPSHVQVVVASADEGSALRAYDINAADYMLLPASEAAVCRFVSRVLERSGGMPMQAPNRRYLVLKSEYKTIQIEIDTIDYIEGQKDYVKLYLDSYPWTVSTLLNMSALQRYLPADKFMRVHRSFIINTDKISTVDRNRIAYGKTLIPISESYKEKFYNFIRSRMAESASLF